MATAAKHSKQETDGDSSFIEKIDEIQSEIDKLNEKASEEILKVEQKFNKARQPLFQKRAELIAKVKNFWMTTLLSHPSLQSMCTDEDEKVLEHLTKVEVEEDDDIKSGYKIHFHFDSNNPYFTNAVLTKEIKLTETGNSTSSSTKINWKPGKDLTKQAPQRNGSQAQGGKRGHGDQGQPSFFCWWSDGEMADVMGEELGEVIKDEIWPNPLQFFLAHELNEEEDTDDDDVGDDDEDVDDDEDYGEEGDDDDGGENE